MHANLSRLAVPVMIGVGAAFDFHAGLVRQAPRWIQRSGLEWAFRLCIEPKRLWRRYLKNNPRFIAKILAHPRSVRLVARDSLLAGASAAGKLPSIG